MLRALWQDGVVPTAKLAKVSDIDHSIVIPIEVRSIVGISGMGAKCLAKLTEVGDVDVSVAVHIAK